MATNLNVNVEDELERWLDAGVSVDRVLLSLASICDGKAQHLAENWQDDVLARMWVLAGNVISRAAMSRAIQDMHEIGF